MNEDPAAIRKFLTEHFSDNELTTFCFDYFPEVKNDFTVGMTKNQKVIMLIEYSQRRAQIARLLAGLERERPELFNKPFATSSTVTLQAPELQESNTRNKRQVFISHANQDAQFATRLAADLKKRDWQVWIAPGSIRPGEKWVEAINRGLSTSGVFVLVLSAEAIKSRWVRSETNIAVQWEHQSKLRFVPLKITKTALRSVPPLWQGYQQIPFHDSYQSGLELLFRELEPQKMSQLAQEYTQLQEAARLNDWDAVVRLGTQITAAYPDYRDVLDLLETAENEKQQSMPTSSPLLGTKPQINAQLSVNISQKKNVPIWGRILIVVIVLTLIAIAILGIKPNNIGTFVLPNEDPTNSFDPNILYGSKFPELENTSHNTCEDSFLVQVNQAYLFFSDDTDNWYTFVLDTQGNVIVALSEFTSKLGQIVVYKGNSCSQLDILGNNGNSNGTKLVSLGTQSAGRYFVRILNASPINSGDSYRLIVNFE